MITTKIKTRLYVLLVLSLLFIQNITSHTYEQFSQLSILQTQHTDSSKIEKPSLLGVWKFHRQKCINMDDKAHDFEFIKITKNEILFYSGKIKKKNHIKTEKYSIEAQFSDPVFSTNHTKIKELWAYFIDAKNKTMRIFRIDSKVHKRSLFNQLHYGHLQRIE
jgi:hypothetical protein